METLLIAAWVGACAIGQSPGSDPARPAIDPEQLATWLSGDGLANYVEVVDYDLFVELDPAAKKLHGKGTVTWKELDLGEIRAVIGSKAPFRDHPLEIDTIRPKTQPQGTRRPGRPRITDPIARARKRQRRAAA